MHIHVYLHTDTPLLSSCLQVVPINNYLDHSIKNGAGYGLYEAKYVQIVVIM